MIRLDAGSNQQEMSTPLLRPRTPELSRGFGRTAADAFTSVAKHSFDTGLTSWHISSWPHSSTVDRDDLLPHQAGAWKLRSVAEWQDHRQCRARRIRGCADLDCRAARERAAGATAAALHEGRARVPHAWRAA